MTPVERLKKKEKIRALKRKVSNINKYCQLENDRDLTEKEEKLIYRMLKQVVDLEGELHNDHERYKLDTSGLS